MKEKRERIDDTMAQLKIRDTILDSLSVAIYVSDLETNEILYANMALQQMHQDRPLTGMVCWEALNDETKRCVSCPIPYLLKHPGKDYRRELYNGRHLKLYDSIIPWANGKLAHLQYAVDITREYP